MGTLARILLPIASVFMLGQGPINSFPREKIDRYVEFADKGVSYPSTMPGDVTKMTLTEYPRNIAQIMYSKGHSGRVSLTTAIFGEKEDLTFMGQNVIDGIPEAFIDTLGIRYFSDITTPEEKRNIINKYSEVIEYFIDSLSTDTTFKNQP